MKWMGLNDLRTEFLNFFESKQHKILNSFSLIPKNDKSLLLINSGMAPMKKFFTGEITPPSKRVTTCQKCIRTPDIERVGITARHGTFFEMLGNFSFGDYFKNEAIAWAWEFCTERLEIPVERLWVSIYKDDDEAFDIWNKKIGLPKERIVRLGKEDNFWEHGVGPCGPCSEIYFDRGEEYGCNSPNCGVGCDCDRYVEIWNLVFTQFNNDGNDNYTPLDHPNIDTGMGLERLACVIQGVDNLFLVDTVQNIMKKVSEITGISYGKSDKTDISLRIITDHIRSTVFMIGDGVLPSNEGRGYVLRRLLRRASRHGRLLGLRGPFLAKLCDTVINENKEAYSELYEKSDFIKKMIAVEEESFERTIDIGIQILSRMVDKAESSVLSGADAFKLNDTYGFPIDLTKEIISEQGMTLDEDEFFKLLDKQKKMARNARKNVGADAWLDDSLDLDDIIQTEFVGYEKLNNRAKILAIIKDGKRVERAMPGDEVGIILDKTSMYANGGGQVGDTGEINSKNSKLSVIDTVKNNKGIFIHIAYIERDIFSCGDDVSVNVDAIRRASIMRNHTAAHLLQAALRKVLGNHVEQAGQLVDSEHLRFDFTHFSALTQDELLKVENLVNNEIFKSIAVNVNEMKIGEAKKIGAMALFGEKYGDIVRVVRLADDFSIEFCAGTHVNNTAKLGLFKITSEGSVASGVRRIQARTGFGVLKLLTESLNTINNCARVLKVNDPKNLLSQCCQLVDENKIRDKQLEALNQKLASMKVDNMMSQYQLVGDIKVITGISQNTNQASLKSMGDKLKSLAPNAVAVIAGFDGEKALLIAIVGENAIKKGVHAGKLVKSVANIVEGNGGGKKDIAMAGVKNKDKINKALNMVKSFVEEMI